MIRHRSQITALIAGSISLLLGAVTVAQTATPQVYPMTTVEAVLWSKDDAGKKEIAFHACKALKANCAKCHAPGADSKAEKHLANILDYSSLIQKGLVKPGDLNSDLYTSITPDQQGVVYMPYDGSAMVEAPGDENLLSRSLGNDHRQTKLSATQVIGIWILAGAPAWQTEKTLFGLGGLDCKSP